MTATLPASTSLSSPAAADTVRHRLTFPVSPDYVASWTAVDGMRELVANAIDDDAAGFTFTYDDARGELVLQDHGRGIPQEGLTLGFSDKNSSQIGQFGEGLCVASLVLARDPAVGPVRVDTVGYGFEPSIQDVNLFPNSRRAGNGSQMLVIDLFENDRVSGTRVTVQGPRSLYEDTRARFRHFETGYTPAASPGEVLTDGPAGRLYIGGVLVSTNPKLLFSYDFALTDAKHLQNRDRTVLDSNSVYGLVQTALGACEDPAVLRKLVQAALDGQELDGMEQHFTAQRTPQHRRAMTALGDELFAGRNVCYQNDNYLDQEALLDLSDRGYEQITSNLPAFRHKELMQALGVRAASTIVRNQELPDQETVWVAKNKLSPEERAVLKQAVHLFKGVFGGRSLGRVDAYESTSLHGVIDHLHWGGFYEPDSGRIGIQRNNLRSLRKTLEILVHEGGHRIGHHGRKEYQDRTREFEWTLGTLAAQALQLIDEHDLIPSPQQQRARAQQQLSEEATTPLGQTRLLLNERLRERYTGKMSVLSRASGVSSYALNRVLRGNSRDKNWQQSPAPQFMRTQAIAASLGVNAAALQVLLITARLPHISRRKNGHVRGILGQELVQHLDYLESTGVLTSQSLAAMRAHVTTAVPDDDTWLAPYRELAAVLATDALPSAQMN